MRELWRRNISIAVVLLATPIVSVASVIVFDPTNFGVNLEQVAQHLELIARLDHQIRNQRQMLEHWNFTQLDELLASMARVQSTVQSATDLDLSSSYSIDPGAYASLDADQLETLGRQRLRSQRTATLRSRIVQIQVAEEMVATQERIADYVREAGDAPGQTAVLQASNETLAQLAGQLQSLQAVELAEMRVEIELEADRQAEAALRAQRRDVLMRDWASLAVSPHGGIVSLESGGPIDWPFSR